ncbi:MAG: YdeI/OmpD-associated family protein [Ignavibacteriaceae bacterium]
MVKFFKNSRDFRKWLAKNHNKSDEIFVGFYKIGTGKKSITYPEALDEALCFGWIDGIRYKIDEESYKIRFTPRRKNSNWSKVNTLRAKQLHSEGKMNPAGIAAFNSHKLKSRITYSYEERIEKLNTAYVKIFSKNKTAWDYFTSQAPYLKKTLSFWVMSAKKEETRLRRLNKLIDDCSNKRRPDILNPGKRKD